MSIAQAAARIGLSLPTLYRLAETLAARGFAHPEARPTRLSLGPAVLDLARAFLSALDPVRLARPLLARLREETGETAFLALRRGDEHIVVAEEVWREVLAISRGEVFRGACAIAAPVFDTEETAIGAIVL